MDRGQDDEVKSLLQQILASQQQGQQDVLTVKKDIRFVKSDIEVTKNNIKHVKTDIKDMDNKYDLRMRALEEKYDRLLRQPGHGQRQAQGQGFGPGQHHHPKPTATTTATSTANKVVIGGWTSPQLQRVVEDRLRQLCSDVGVTPKDLFARKRAAVGFVCCKNSDDMHTLIRHTKNTKPLTNVLGDNGAMWAKQSQGPEERARTLGLRCAARSFFTHFEGAAGGGLPSQISSLTTTAWGSSSARTSSSPSSMANRTGVPTRCTSTREARKTRSSSARRTSSRRQPLLPNEMEPRTRLRRSRSSRSTPVV